MSKPSLELISALRKAASRLQNGAHYAWGHHGACNCGQLVQVVSQLTEGEIIRYAHTGTGEWTELAEDFCSITNAPYTLLMAKLDELGLNASDIHHIEYLSDKEVLQHLSGGFRWLKRNKREDAIAYFEAFANMLEEKMAQQLNIDFNKILSMETAPSEPQPVVV